MRAGTHGLFQLREDMRRVSAVTIAYASANLGDIEAAFQWLERAVVERDVLIAFIHIYTEVFAPELISDQRYGALLARLNLSDVAGQTRS